MSKESTGQQGVQLWYTEHEGFPSSVQWYFVNVVPKALSLGAYGCMGVPIFSYQKPGGSVRWLLSLAQDRTYIGGIEISAQSLVSV
jgi:hypothetical protein